MNALLDGWRERLSRFQAGGNRCYVARDLRASVPGSRGERDFRVRSIVGRSSSIAAFITLRMAGTKEIYIGSADWMPRNLYERVEVLVPLRDEMLRQRVRHEILDAYLADNRKARILLKDETYIRAWQPMHGKRNRRMPTGAAAFSAQEFLMSVAEGKAPAALPAPASSRKRKVVAGRER